jgi:hypothetical protein
MIDKYVSPRDDILIHNKYEIIKDNQYEDDFHMVIYYINESKCKIIIRRLDSECGWGLDLCVKIDDEIISLGSSYKNNKVLYLYTNIRLLPYIPSLQNIPKTIIQTARDLTYKSLLHYNAVKTILELNPEYEYKFFTDSDCREFIKSNFSSDVLDSYDMLYPNAYKADLFRYCYIYINGGCYFDNKYILRMPLHRLIDKNDINIYCKDRGDNLMFNSIIISVKNATEIKNCIDAIVNHVKNNYYGSNSLEPTGPGLFNRFTYDKNILLKHIVDGKDYKDSKILIKSNNIVFANTHYKGYYTSVSKQDYAYIFNQKNIYFKNIQKKSGYTILVYPHNNTDLFDVNYDDILKKISIKRVDKNEGWGLDLKIKIINNKDNTENTYIIGSSSYNIVDKFI